MAILEGVHARAGGRQVAYCAEYEVAGTAIHFKARFDNGDTHEGEFDFDPSRLDAADAVDAFMHDHIEKADRDVAP